MSEQRFEGINGIPFYTAKSFPNGAPDIRESEVIRRGTVEIYVFDMNIEDQMKAYANLQSDYARGRIDVSMEQVQWVPENKNWKIFLRIIRFYLTLKEEDLIR